MVTYPIIVIGFEMDYSEEGCDQSYCSMNNVLIKFSVFPRAKLKTNLDFSY